MPPVTNYSKYLGDLEPIQTMRSNVEKIRNLTKRWAAERFD